MMRSNTAGRAARPELMGRINSTANRVVDFGPRDLIMQSILWQFIGIALLVCHIVLVKLSIALYPVVILVIGWIFIRSSIAGFLVFWQSLLFQNWLIAIFSTNMDYSTFNILQGTNFVLLVMLAGIATLRLLPSIDRAIGRSIMIAIGLIMIYSVMGAAKAGPNSAIVYVREFSSPILAGIIGIEVGRLWGFRTVGLCLLYGAAFAMTLNVIEYFNPLLYYSIINEVTFLQLKTSLLSDASIYYTPQDVVIAYTNIFFNITGANAQNMPLQSFRFAGTIINPISNAYVMAVLAIIAVSVKRSYWLFFLIPMLIMVGVKGANIFLLSSLLLYAVWVYRHSRRELLIAGLILSATYITLGLYLGLQNDDFHVLGFMGGMKSLMHDPIGHGIGVGGNLSSGATKGFKWVGQGGFVNSGVDFALESAIGVLVYQMGVAGLAILAVFGTFLWRAPWGLAARHDLPVRSDIVFIALGMVMVNGVFQEEAFAPYAAGLIMSLSGVLVGNQRRAGQVYSPRPLLDPLPALSQA